MPARTAKGGGGLYPIPVGSSSEDRHYYHLIGDAIREGKDLAFVNNGYEFARFMVGSLIAGAQESLFFYCRTLEDRDISLKEDKQVDPNIVRAFKDLLEREVKVGIVTDEVVPESNPLDLLFRTYVGGPAELQFRVLNESGQKLVDGKPHFIVMDRRAYRVESDREVNICSANAHFNEAEHASILAHSFERYLLSDEFSTDARVSGAR